MTALADLLERAHWRHRTAPFGELRESCDRAGRDFVGMELVFDGVRDDLVDALWRVWVGLPAHPQILDAVTTHDGARLVRYAAIDWRAKPVRDVAQLATWGIELARIARFLVTCVPEGSRGWLACPFMVVDVEGSLRVGFVPPPAKTEWMVHVPPETAADWPRCDERGMVHVVGTALRRLVDGEDFPELRAIVDRCCTHASDGRFATLNKLVVELVRAGGQRKPPFVMHRGPSAWNHVETGLAYLALDMPKLARQWFDTAVYEHARERPTAPTEDAARLRSLRDEVAKRVADLDAVPWTTAAATGAALEAQRRHGEARELYRRVRRDGADLVALDLAIARCSFELGDLIAAADSAERVLQHAPTNEVAHAMCATAKLRVGWFAAAREAAARWLAVAPDDGHAHLVHAKILVALGRVVEARAALERASARGPHVLEALHLRRELDRRVGAVRAAAGSAVPMPLDVPVHLARVRDALAQGGARAAIELLRDASYHSDPDAQLLLAALLVSQHDLADSLAIYERLARDEDARSDVQLTARLGEADVLLALDRAPDALAIFDALVARDPALAVAHDGRARALRVLGREADAEAAAATFTRLEARRSDARLASLDD